MITPAALPPLQAAWLDQFLGGPIPAEKNATCDTCAMLVDATDNGAPQLPGYNAATNAVNHRWGMVIGWTGKGEGVTRRQLWLAAAVGA